MRNSEADRRSKELRPNAVTSENCRKNGKLRFFDQNGHEEPAISFRRLSVRERAVAEQKKEEMIKTHEDFNAVFNARTKQVLLKKFSI